MLANIFGPEEIHFAISLGVSLLCGVLIGFERELKGKPAGISTQTLVVTGSMTFAFLSGVISEGDPTRIAAQIVSGIGFLGAGIILKSEKRDKVTNVTTAASIWYSAAVGMAIGFELFVIAIMATVYILAVNRIPHVKTYIDE